MRPTLVRWTGVLVVLVIVLALALGLALASGPSAIALSQVLAALSGGEVEPATADIVLRVRLPRAALAMGVGASLSVSGVLFQALLRNPLADPYVLGVSGGAALGGIVVLSLGAGVGLGYQAVPPAAFVGAVATAVLLFAVAGGRGRLSATHLLLTGVVFNAFASAAIVFLASLSGLSEGASIFLWLIGNLSAARVDVVGWVVAFLFLGLACAMPLARGLNLLTLGEESAQQLGVDVEKHKRVLLGGTSLMVGAAVAAAGLIGFVGLIVPHGLRLMVGPDHRLLIPSSALAGAAFLVVCDTAARTLFDGRELPVGAITALVGGPLFLWLLRRDLRQSFAS
ncbi:iron ABC transporter permease [Myxococcota bacterium]|nr:iron ABC transporter permease [Myxococcota bacterium]